MPHHQGMAPPPAAAAAPRPWRDETPTERRFSPWVHAAGLAVALASLVLTETAWFGATPAWLTQARGWERALCPTSWLWTVRFDAHWTTSPFLVAGVLGNGVLWDWVAACVHWASRGRRWWALALLVLAIGAWWAWCLRSGAAH